jgi:hypothetical protein
MFIELAACPSAVPAVTSRSGIDRHSVDKSPLKLNFLDLHLTSRKTRINRAVFSIGLAILIAVCRPDSRGFQIGLNFCHRNVSRSGLTSLSFLCRNSLLDTEPFQDLVGPLPQHRFHAELPGYQAVSRNWMNLLFILFTNPFSYLPALSAYLTYPVWPRFSGFKPVEENVTLGQLSQPPP